MQTTNNFKKVEIFSKGWPHDESGEPIPEFFDWFNAMLSGDTSLARQIAAEHQNKYFVNPYINDFDQVDRDVVDQLDLKPPVFDSEQHVLGMLEVYKFALLRDSSPKKPFSYFLTASFKDGAEQSKQEYGVYEAGKDYGIDLLSYQEIQNGTDKSKQPEFCIFQNLNKGTMRGLTTFVHNDCMSQYRHAHQILAQLGANKNPGMQEMGDTSFVNNGDAENAGLVGEGIRALKAAWLVKWDNYFIRPETYAGLSVQNPCAVPNLTKALNASMENEDDHDSGQLLALAFPEGSPGHSEYMPGHSVLSGYQGTIIKARWDEGFVLPNNTTIRQAADALAEEIGIGRVWAGVHYRFSHNDGLKLGEAIAIKVLQEHLNKVRIKCHLRFTKFDGTTVVLNNTKN